jgi:hypothetical protein
LNNSLINRVKKNEKMSKENSLIMISQQIESASTSSSITPNVIGGVLREMINSVSSYNIHKATFNLNYYLEIGDVISGLWNNSKYVIAKYNGGNIEDINNFEVVFEQEFSLTPVSK